MIEENNNKDIDQKCEECKENHENVFQNLIMYGYKICDSCKISKTIFPIQKPLNKNKIKNKANACINQATITTPRRDKIRGISNDTI